MEENNKMNLKVFNMAADPSIESQPLFNESFDRGGWVKFGIDNLAPQKLIELMNRSSLHNSILKSKAMMMGGNGFIKENLSVGALNFIKNVYNKEDLEEIVSKISYDFELYGSFALNVIWSKDRTKIAEINYIDVSKVRIETPEPGFDIDDIKGYYVSQKWDIIKKYPPVLFPAFSKTDRSQASQILYVKEHRPGFEFYGEPEYLSAVNWIELEWNISEFHNQSVKQGFHPSMIINFNEGIPSDEEMRKMIGRLRGEYEGANNSGKVIFTFASSAENAPTITPIQLNDSDERFIQLYDKINDSIYKGHRVTNPVIFGQIIPGKLGTKDEMLESLAIFQSNYITPKQRTIEKVINKLARINGITDELFLSKYAIEFNKVTAGIENTVSICSNDKLTPEQKFYILIYSGFEKEESINLSGFDPDAIVEESPVVEQPIVEDITKNNN